MGESKYFGGETEQVEREKECGYWSLGEAASRAGSQN